MSRWAPSHRPSSGDRVHGPRPSSNPSHLPLHRRRCCRGARVRRQAHAGAVGRQAPCRPDWRRRARRRPAEGARWRADRRPLRRRQEQPGTRGRDVPEGADVQRLPAGLRPRRRVRRRGRQHLRTHARLRHAAGAAAGQARLLREAADAQRATKPASSAKRRPRPSVATQMGTQIHAGDNYRRVVELDAGGRDRPGQRVSRLGGRAPGAGTPAKPKRPPPRTSSSSQHRPTTVDPVPAGLDWDLWLGPAPARPFNNVYLPGPKWYRWWDFGNGTMSDLGSHWIDLPFWALEAQVAAQPSKRQGPPVAPRDSRPPRCRRATTTAPAATSRRSR